jgi:hypothetical protein
MSRQLYLRQDIRILTQMQELIAVIEYQFLLDCLGHYQDLVQ